MERITSLHNRCVKEVLGLRETQGRQAMGVAVIDGVREIERALRAGIAVEKVFCLKEVQQDLLKRLEAKGVDLIEVTRPVMEKIAYGQRHEGILALARVPSRPLKDLKLSHSPLVVVLESLEKPGNLGAVLRTSDAVGVEAIFVCDPKTDVYNPNVIRSSTGVVFSLPVVCANPSQIISFLKSRKINICATQPEASKVYTQVDLKGPLALVMGSEDQGLSDHWIKAADMTVKIPMKGIADSLNVSVSAAVILYEALRQRSAA